MLTADKQIKLRIIGYYITSKDDMVYITNSYDESIKSNNVDDLIEFLYKPYRTDEIREIKFMYNLDECVAHLFRLMPESQCREIYNTKFKESGKIYYHTSLNLGIKGDKKFNVNGRELDYTAWFYSLNNFFDVDPEPTNAIETVRLGFKLLEGIHNIGIDYPRSLNSAIGMWLSANKRLQYTPSITDIPTGAIQALEYGFNCSSHQGWVTADKVGYFKDAYEYDLSSAYGEHLRNIRDFKTAEYSEYKPNHEWKEYIKTGDVTGFFKCKISINKNIKLHPFFKRWNQENIIYPVGTWETYLVLEEILYIYRRKLGTVEILSGWYVKFKNNAKPMFNVVNRWFGQRELGEMENNLAKGIITGYVGQMRHRGDDNETSQIYFPLISAIIYAKTRLQVLDFIIDNCLENDVIAIQTDSVISTKQALNTPVPEKKTIGKWKFEGKMDVVVLSSGYIWKGNKRPHSITKEMLFKMVNANPESNYYKVIINKTVTLWEALERFKNYKMVGTKADFDQTLDLVGVQTDLYRLFKEFPETGKDLITKSYSSEPIEVG